MGPPVTLCRSDSLMVSNLTFILNLHLPAIPALGMGWGWGPAEIKNGVRESSVNGGRNASAPSRPWGPGRSAGHSILEGLKTDLAENANEDTSGLAPGLGNGVSRGRTNTSDGYFAFELHVRDHCLTSQGDQMAKLRWSDCFGGWECTSNIKVLVCMCKQF